MQRIGKRLFAFVAHYRFARLDAMTHHLRGGSYSVKSFLCTLYEVAFYIYVQCRSHTEMLCFAYNGFHFKSPAPFTPYPFFCIGAMPYLQRHTHTKSASHHI
jgi:hypothetical protein